MIFQNRNDARNFINSKITELPKAKKRGYICPLCQNGTGEDGDGITSKDGKHYTCWKCGFSGDYLDFLKEQHNTDENGIFRMFDVEIQKRNTTQNKNTQNSNADAVNFEDFFLQAINDLWKDKNALEYLYARNLTVETIHKFKLGYVENWIHPKGGKFPTKRIIIPTSENSYVARAIEPTEKPKMKVNNGILNIDALFDDEIEPVFIVEGETDCMSVCQLGYKAIALGSLNNAGLLLQAIEKRTPNKPVIISLDNDSDEKTRELARKTENKIQTALNAIGVKSITANTCGIFKDQNEYLQNDADGMKADLETIKNKMYKPHNISEYLNNAFFADITRNENTAKPQTGFSAIDIELNGGLHNGLYMIGAIPSLGKTTFMLQIADYLAMSGKDVIFFSLEQSRFELASKSIAREIGISEFDRTGNATLTSVDIRQGKRKNEVIQAVQQYTKKIGNHLNIVTGNFAVTVQYIKNYVTAYVKRNKVTPIVIVDYLQIIQPEKNMRFFGTREMTDYNLTELKKFQADNNLIMFVISALNRENYLLPLDFKSFRETSGIEYTADFVSGLQLQAQHEDIFFDDGKDGKTSKKREILNKAKQDIPRKLEFVALKNRYGKLFSCGFAYYPHFDYFQEDEMFTYRHDAKQVLKKF